MENYLKQFLDLVKVHRFEELYSKDITAENYFGFPLRSIVEAEKRLLSAEEPSVAYFSMEYGLGTSIYNTFIPAKPVSESNILPRQNIFSNMRIRDYYFSFKVDHRIMDLPIYSGGLGVLAGDTLKSSADLNTSLSAIGILWRKGYFKQNFWYKDGQVPEALNWDPYSYPGLIPLDTVVKIPLNGGDLLLRLWKYYVYSFDKNHVIPLTLLDSDVEGNNPEFRRLTDQLYRSDNSYIKIVQRVILGIGGIKALEALGYSIKKYHLNEGHAALALVQKADALQKDGLASLEKDFIYTCHTPVAAGHDRFPIKELEKILPRENIDFIRNNGLEGDDTANFTQLLLNCCDHVNAVAKKHGEVTRLQFPQHADKIQTITNGIHIPTWISGSFSDLLKKYGNDIGQCASGHAEPADLEKLRNNSEFRLDLWKAHQENKRNLQSIFESWDIRENVFTVCWARRIAAYKRPSLIFQDPRRLVDIANRVGPVQVIIAGKAHPNDNLVGTFINNIMNTIDALGTQGSSIRIIMLENYDIFFGKILSNSVDVWLNNPLPPFEASGTSGMKAILNGVVQLSTLDGWVVEAADAGMGEIFGYRHKTGEPIGNELDLRLDADSGELYNALEKLVKLYYETNRNGNANAGSKWIDIMINCMIQSHYFNTCRMVKEYRDRMWFDKN
ncbi:MAG: alpha-glucan family phosphorylase [Candidatus Omnitrophica bacterium]|nr:alpha-glucan family phosphorylase [Candidatus Omnitrophota bacterium]MDD5546865.1 alpha-glucan family phosphorylase [Candidatus Omnitrophota bacterium]